MQVAGFDSADMAAEWPTAPAVDGSPKQFSSALQLARYAMVALRVTIACRWPILVALVPLVGLWLILSGAVGAAVAPVVGVAGVWRSSFLRRRFRAAVVNTQTIVFTAVVWPLLCSTKGLIEPSARRVRIAKLVSVDFGPGWWWKPDHIAVTFRPLAKHEPSAWPGYESRIRSFFDYLGSTWSPDPDNPNQLTVTVRRKALPARLIVGQDVDIERLNPPTAHESSTYRTPDEVFLGLGNDGHPIVWCPDESGRSSLFITGRHGSGKGFIAKLIMRYAAAAGWRVRVINPKATGEFRWLGEWADHAKSPAAMFELIHEFRVEMERRAHVLDAHGAATWDDLPLSILEEYDMAHRDVLVIDELVSLMAMKGIVIAEPPVDAKGKAKGRPVDLHHQMVNDVQAIASMGRSQGMSLIGLTQHPIAETMGPIGSTLKANLGARIGVGYLEPEGAGALFGKGQGETVANILRGGRPGKCVIQGLANADGGHWRVGQIVFAANTALAPMVPADAPAHACRNFDDNDNDGPAVTEGEPS